MRKAVVSLSLVGTVGLGRSELGRVTSGGRGRTAWCVGGAAVKNGEGCVRRPIVQTLRAKSHVKESSAVAGGRESNQGVQMMAQTRQHRAPQLSSKSEARGKGAGPLPHRLTEGRRLSA